MDVSHPEKTQARVKLAESEDEEQRNTSRPTVEHTVELQASSTTSVAQEQKEFLKEAYYFLMKKQFPILRQIHRTWKYLYQRVKQDTRKLPFVCNLMHVVRTELIKGSSLEDLFSEEYGNWGFRAFHENWENIKRTQIEPCWDRIFSSVVMLSPPRYRPESRKSAVSKFAPGFSTEELARLFVMIAKEGVPRDAIHNSTLELTREQLDRGHNRDAFWSNIISQLFNDPSFTPSFSFDGIVEGIDISNPPPTKRDGPYLKRQYQAAQKCFSVAYHNWRKSGENDPDLFFRFTELRRDETLSPDGEKAVVMFHVLRCGTQFLDTSLMDCVYRRIGGSTKKGFGCGAGVTAVEPRRKRRRSTSASPIENDGESMKEIANYATTQWSRSVATSGKMEQSTRCRLEKDVDRTLWRVNKLRELTKALSGAEEMSKTGPMDTRELWKSIYDGVLRDIRDFYGKEKTNNHVSPSSDGDQGASG